MPDEHRESALNKVSVNDSLANEFEVEKQLEEFLTEETLGDNADQYDAVELVEKIAALKDEDQRFVVQWAKIINQSDAELVAPFLKAVSEVFTSLDQKGVEAWVVDALRAFDNNELENAVEAFINPADFISDYVFRHNRCTFDSVYQFLQHFVIGLGGRELNIVKHHEAYTDTEKLFLPDHIKECPDTDLNASLYKLTVVHLWAQTRYGTWRYQVLSQLASVAKLAVEKAKKAADDLIENSSGQLIDNLTEQSISTAPTVNFSAVTADIFNHLECIRLDACIAREFPGLHRQLEQLAYCSDDHKNQWDAFRREVISLTEPAATVLDSIALIEPFFGKALPDLKRYQGKVDLASIRKVMQARVNREKTAVQEALAELKRTIQQVAGVEEGSSEDAEDRQFSLMDVDDVSHGDSLNIELRYDDELVQMTPEIETLIESILQDFGEIPDNYTDGITVPYSSETEADLGDHGLVMEENELLKNTIRYREWDYLRDRYREGYCLLNEYDVPPVDDHFVEDTLEKYRGLLKSIKKTFEAVLGESKLLRRQSHGDDIDIDALIEAQADFISGMEMSDNVYTRYRNRDRSIAVMFMVDMSGSTHGWINDAERESLVLLCEALETLGDRYAIYGFSGKTNKRCETYRIKRFDEAYSSDVRQRISGIRSKGFTRMGAAIRHLGHLLNMSRARTKILITLSDGRPEDYDAYRGRYAIEDTRHALQELRHDGIHSFCITIDREAQDYLPHMYGVANYTVIHEVKKLPLKVADIYRRLTTL